MLSFEGSKIPKVYRSLRGSDRNAEDESLNTNQAREDAEKEEALEHSETITPTGEIDLFTTAKALMSENQPLSVPSTQARLDSVISTEETYDAEVGTYEELKAAVSKIVNAATEAVGKINITRSFTTPDQGSSPNAGIQFTRNKVILYSTAEGGATITQNAGRILWVKGGTLSLGLESDDENAAKQTTLKLSGKIDENGDATGEKVLDPLVYVTN